MTNRIFFKLLGAFLVVIVVTAVTFDVMLGGAWEASLRSEIERNLTQKTRLLAHRVETDRSGRSLADIAAQEGQAAGARATIIDPTGQVLADSETNPASMENQSDRKEFMAALSGHLGMDERPSLSVGIPFLYVAVPVSGGAVRLAYPLSDVEAISAQVHRRLALASVFAFVFALVVAGVASTWSAQRLDHIVDVAARIADGDLQARVEERSQDEIGRVAGAIDRTARQVEQSFAAVQSSQRQLETLLNSMQDAVIAVDNDGVVEWANETMNGLVPQRVRLQAPVVETIRDPDFLATVKAATTTHEVKTSRATSIVPGRAFDVTAAPLPGGGAVAVLRDLPKPNAWKKPAATSSPTFPTNCARLSPPFRAMPKLFSTAPQRASSPPASFWKSFARTPLACLASPKTCSPWLALNPEKPASMPNLFLPSNSCTTRKKVSGRLPAAREWICRFRMCRGVTALWSLCLLFALTARPFTRFFPT